MKFKPFPVGTVRGPYSCGLGTDHKGGVQFCVQTPDGWVYFIGKAVIEEGKVRKQAEQLSRNLLKNL